MIDTEHDARLKKAVSEAEDAFWDKFASMYPEVKTGDFDPLASLRVDNQLEAAAKLWLYYNFPEGDAEMNNWLGREKL